MPIPQQPDEALPEQLDLITEYGTEILSPDSIRIPEPLGDDGHDDERTDDP